MYRLDSEMQRDNLVISRHPRVCMRSWVQMSDPPTRLDTCCWGRNSLDRYRFRKHMLFPLISMHCQKWQRFDPIYRIPWRWRQLPRGSRPLLILCKVEILTELQVVREVTTQWPILTDTIADSLGSSMDISYRRFLVIPPTTLEPSSMVLGHVGDSVWFNRLDEPDWESGHITYPLKRSHFEISWW